ncbi:MAG: lysogenization protein HflD [Pseudomonadota bacterium]|jgi:high frequency lysogenization protein
MSRKEDEAIALAGVLQAARLVVDLAYEGRCDAAALRASMDSVLRIDASSAAAVFGGLEGLRLGLGLLSEVLDGIGREAMPMRIAATVLHLERKLARRPDLNASLARGIEATARDLGRGELDDDGLAERLGQLYGETLSTLKPRVVVQGNGVFLSQPAIVGRIRAALLGAVRAAVLWRQMGGNRLRLLLGRRGLAARARALRASLP